MSRSREDRRKRGERGKRKRGVSGKRVGDKGAGILCKYTVKKILRKNWGSPAHLISPLFPLNPVFPLFPLFPLSRSSSRGVGPEGTFFQGLRLRKSSRGETRKRGCYSSAPTANWRAGSSRRKVSNWSCLRSRRSNGSVSWKESNR